MGRSRLARLVGAALLAAVLLPQTAMAASASPSTTVVAPQIRLSCALTLPNPLQGSWPSRADVCHWTAPTGITVAKYRVWRSVDAGSRVLVGTVASTRPLRFTDWNIRTGHDYHYFVAGVNTAGARVAWSNVASVWVGRAPQTLALNCVLVIDGATDWVNCRWSATSRAAVRYVLYRSVDGGARTVIDRVAIPGPRFYSDRNVKAGERIRYAVVALDRYGHVVAWASPDFVEIPR